MIYFTLRHSGDRVALNPNHIVSVNVKKDGSWIKMVTGDVYEVCQTITVVVGVINDVQR